jgi:O-antigen ligase
MPARRPQLAELGLFLLVVALPLVFTPFSASPFGDPKLVVLAWGTLALWASGLPIDRRLAWAAAAWVGVTIVAALTGVDASVGLTARTEGQGGGAIVLGCAGALAVLGSGLSDELRELARRWLVMSGVVVAVLGLAIRMFPDASTWLPSDIEMVGATLGNQLFAAAFLAAAVAAAIVGGGSGSHGASGSLNPRTVALVAFLALGAATFGERSSIVVPVIAGAAVLWRARLGVRATFVMACAVVVPLIAWQAIDATVLPDTTGRGAAVTGIEAQATDVQRVTVWRVMGRATLDRPVLGWGPGSAGSGYLAAVTASEVEDAGRRWADAHNLFLETAVTSGVLGLAALVWLVVLLTARSLRAGRDRAWAFGAAAGLAAYSVVEPIGLVLTSLLFLIAGIAAGPARVTEAERAERPAWGRRAVTWGVGAMLAVATVVSLQMLVAAGLERWGRVYGETWALEDALRVQPWRLSSAERLAFIWALDGRAGDEAAAQRARDEIGRAVLRHPWDGDVRLWAADVETLLRDEVAARAWIDEHLARFPGDVPSAEEVDPDENA